MNFSDIKEGDTIRINIAAHMGRKGFGKPPVEKPAKSMIVCVRWITEVAGQPGRLQASCTVADDDEGNVYTGRNPMGFIDGPSFTFYSDDAGTGKQTFEKV